VQSICQAAVPVRLPRPWIPGPRRFKASPATLDQLTSSARKRVEDIFQETQPIVFGLLAPSRVESVTWPETQRFSDSGCALAFYHCATIPSDFPERQGCGGIAGTDRR
jgi:hypothetical protein